MTPYASIEGARCTRVEVCIPGIGVWFADVELEEAPSFTGRATLALGELRLTGTIDPTHDGTIALTRRLRLVGGGNGWSKLLQQRSYHSDSGVRARTVAEDVAREAGETLASFDVPSPDLGIDYARTAGPAAMTLADVVGSTPWWVDLDGQTRVGTRVPSDAPAGSYEVLDVEPDQQLVTLAVDDLRQIGIGSVLSERLDAPMIIREMAIEVEGEAIRVRAWCGATETSESRLARTFRSLVKQVASERIVGGPWRYRVVRMAGDRVELQAVVRDAGLPDLGPIAMWPGIAGASAELSPGAEVLIDFIDGDRRQPIIRGFAPLGGAGHVPVNAVLDIKSLLKLGANADDFVALAALVKERLDSIQSTFDSHIHTTTATVGTGSVGVISAPTSTIGSLDSVAASKVKAE